MVSHCRVPATRLCNLPAFTGKRAQRMQGHMNGLLFAFLLGSASLIAGCGSSEDKAFAAGAVRDRDSP